MRWKKVMSGVLSGALLITSVAPVSAAATDVVVEEAAQEATVEAEDVAVEAEEAEAVEVVGDEATDVPEAYAEYSFDNTLMDSKDFSSEATALVTGLTAYTGDVVYAEGRTGQAVKLGDYGLKLDTEDLGTDYTVSAWFNTTSTLAANQCMLFLGYHSPEKWLSLAGAGSGSIKLWTNGGSYAWSQLTTSSAFKNNEWHQATIVGESGNATLYVDGVKVGSYGSVDALDGENQSIYLGVNYWDPEYTGLVDDLQIFDQALTADQVAAVYDNKVAAPSSEIEMPEAYAEYSLEGTLQNGASEETDEAVITVKGLGSTTKTAVYSDEGKEGKALKVGDYGIRLNKANIGTTYTVSAWVKPDSTLTENQYIMFLGYNNPEKWVGIAGQTTGTSTCKVWANVANSSDYAWVTKTTVDLTKDQWHMVTLASDEDSNVDVYLDGVLVDTVEMPAALDGENQDIYFGPTAWDPSYTGLLDEIKVYDTQLTAAQVAELYDPTPVEDLLKAEGSVQTAASLDLASGETGSVDLTLPNKVAAYGPVVKYTSSDDTVATVDEDGTVTAVSQGTATITTKVQIISTIVTSETAVTVTGLNDAELQAQIAVAESINPLYYTEESYAKVTELVEEGKAAETQALVDHITASLKKALEDLEYKTEYANPWTAIEAVAPATTKTMNVGESAQLLVIPDSVKDFVDVEYISSNDSAATYVDGTVTAKKAGKTTVTAIVTAKYNAYVMEYTTALDITGTTAAPAQVKKVTVTATTNKATIKWGKVSGATSYEVYRLVNKKYKKIATVTKTSYVNTKLTSGTAYSYKVRAVKDGVAGKYSAVAKVITKPGKTTITSLKANGANKATLKFKQVKNANVYYIYKYDSSKKKYAVAFKVQGKNLYKYNGKKYVKAGKATLKNGVYTVTLTGVKKNQQINIKAGKTQSGYKAATGAASKAKKIK